jgi:hypothetical protein
MLIEESGSVWDASPGSAPGRLHQLGGGSPPDSTRRNDGETAIQVRIVLIGRCLREGNSEIRPICIPQTEFEWGIVDEFIKIHQNMQQELEGEDEEGRTESGKK